MEHLAKVDYDTLPYPVQRMPKVGDRVLYCLSSGYHVGEERPADVVRVWGAVCVNLQVITDGPNDFKENEPGYKGMFWATSALHNTDPKPGHWRWGD